MSRSYNFILLRGLTREAGHWGPFLELLEAQDYCKSVLTIDLPGTGVYHKISAPKSITENAEFIVAKIKEKQLEGEPNILFAISLGAMVAIEALHRYPYLFQQAFLLNTSVRGLSPIYDRLQLNAFKRLYRIITSKDLQSRERNVLEMVSLNQGHWEKTAEEWAEIARLRPVHPMTLVNQLWAASRYTLPKSKPDLPIHIFVSSNDPMVSSRCSEAIAQHWNLPIAHNHHTGHEMTLDDPQWVVDQVRKDLI